MIEVLANGVKWRLRDGYGADLIDFLNQRSDDTHNFDAFDRPRRLAAAKAKAAPSVKAIAKAARK